MESKGSSLVATAVAQVQSLVGELRYQKPCGPSTKKTKTKKKGTI